MTPEDMFKEPESLKPLADKDVKELWPQARGELWAFAENLTRRGMTITALQLRMAVTLADEAYVGRFGPMKPPPSGKEPEIVWEKPPDG
jgi:hypothetical protein